MTTTPDRYTLLRMLADDLVAADDPGALAEAVLELVSNVAHETTCQPGSFAAAYEEYVLNESLVTALNEANREQRARLPTDPPPERW